MKHIFATLAVLGVFGVLSASAAVQSTRPIYAVDGAITVISTNSATTNTIVDADAELLADSKYVVTGGDATTALQIQHGTATNGQTVTFSAVYLAAPNVTANWTDPFGGGASTNAPIRCTITSNTVVFNGFIGVGGGAPQTNLSWIAVGQRKP